jgi:murein DD-endopeptidase MepM/ murein hydrolase activator NlpD
MKVFKVFSAIVLIIAVSGISTVKADTVLQKYSDQVKAARASYEDALEKNTSLSLINNTRRQYLLAQKKYNEYKIHLKNQNSSALEADTENDQITGVYAPAVLNDVSSQGKIDLSAIVIEGPAKEDILKNKYGYIDAGMVNIRTGPGVENSKIDCLPRGTDFTVLDYKDGWYKAKFSNNRIGWIAGWLVRTTAEKTNTESSDNKLAGRFVQTGRVTSEFGWRIHPIQKTRKFHNGIDLGAPKGTPVLSLGTGVVTFAGWSNGYGRLVKVKYDNGYTCYYAHLDNYAGMTPGTRVTRGQTVGKVNSSGMSTGNHVHFEVRTPDGTPVNPRSIDGIII